MQTCVRVRVIAACIAAMAAIVTTGCGDDTKITQTVNPAAPSSTNPEPPQAATVTSVTVTPSGTINLVRSAQGGECQATVTLNAEVKGTGSFYNAVTWHLTPVGTGASISPQNQGDRTGLFRATANGTWQVWAKSAQQGYVQSNVVTINVSGDCGGVPQPPQPPQPPGPTPPPPPPPPTPGQVLTSIDFVPRGGEMQVNTQQQLDAICFDQSGIRMGCPPNLAWTSSFPARFQVSATGNPVQLRAIGLGPSEICVVVTGTNIRACHTFTGVSGPTQPPPPPPPALTVDPLTLNLFPPSCPQAGPSSGRFVANMSVTWSTPQGSLITVNPTSGPETVVTFVAAGTAQVLATGPQGQTATRTVTLNNCPSQPPPPPPPAMSCELMADRTTVRQNEQVTLTWTSQNASSVVKTGGNDGWRLAANTLSGSFSTTLTTTTTFILTCTNTSGQSIVRQVTVTFLPPSCPNFIDYLPRGGTIRVGQTIQLTVQNWPSADCIPFWYVNRPSVGQITGADTTTVVQGTTYYAGVRGILRGIAPGVVEVCVQTSLITVQPARCYTWTVTASDSPLDALELDPKFTLRFLNGEYVNGDGVAQTFTPKK